MPPSLIRICYISKSSIAAQEVGARQIEAILEESVSWNVEVGITGALFFNRGLFAQVLEGAPTEVEALFHRISKDRRHTSLIRLEWIAIADRMFPDWAMSFVGTIDEDVERFAALGRYQPDDENILRDRMLSLIVDLVKRNEKASQMRFEELTTFGGAETSRTR